MRCAWLFLLLAACSPATPEPRTEVTVGHGDGGGAPGSDPDAGPVRATPPLDQIENALRPAHGPIKDCYDAGLKKNPNLSGQVRIKIEVKTDGTVIKASDAASTIPDRDVIECVRALIGRLPMPQYTQDYEVEKGFRLMPPSAWQKP
jgi:hypothetical protein